MAALQSAGRKILLPNMFIEISFFIFFLYFNSRVNVYLHFTRLNCPHKYPLIIWTFFDRMHRMQCIYKYLSIEIIENSEYNRSNKHRASKNK